MPEPRTSRHRSGSPAAPEAPDVPSARPPRSAWPVASLVLVVIVLVAVQLVSPVAQRVPAGAARFDLAGAWLASRPGALAGYGAWWSPVLGRLQLGLLVRLLQGIEGGTVLAAAQGVLLLLAVVQAVLLWLLLRRTGRSAPAAGLATAVLAVAPASVAVHATVSTAAVAVVWLLLAGLLLLPAGGRARAVLAGAAAGLAVVSHPLTAVPVVVAAAALLAARRRPVERPAAPSARLGAAALGLAAVLLLVAGAAAVCGALPQTAAARALEAVTAAQQPTAAGAAAPVLWSGSDPLGLLVAAVAVVVVSRHRRTRAVGAAAVGLLLASAWPAGADAAAPLAVLLPVAAVAVALTVDRALVALGHPVLMRSLIGSGWLTGVAALLLVAVVVSVSGLVALVPAGRQPVARVAQWLRGSVPPGQVVLVGLGAWPDLERVSGADVGWYATAAPAAAPSSSLPWATADYVVTGAEPGGAAAGAAQRSAVVARFGSGADALAVRAVEGAAGGSDPAAPAPTTSPTATPPTATPPTATPSSSAEGAAATARLRAGEQLAANSRIQLGGGDRALLVSGRVDTRIALVLAQFATSHRVTVSAFGTAPGDDSGIRTTALISAVDGRPVPADVQRTGDLLRFLSALRGDFATRSIDSGEQGLTASFAPDPTFVPSS